MSFIQYITQIQIDFGAVKLLQAECERVGIRKPLIVTDAGVKAAGVLQKALDALPDVPVTVFDQTPSNPTESAVRAAAALYKQNGCDGLIAVGGGSAIDCAKGVAIAVSHEGPLKTYATIEGGSPKITDRVAPIIAVPTTSGTGSEVARGAILILDDGRKVGFHSWFIVPKAAICDPELTFGLPPILTAATGMDAVAHCMDAGQALECVTRVPAEFAGVGDRYGTIAPGMSATLVLWSGDPFEIGSVVRRAWMDGGEIDLNDRQKRMHGKYLEKELQRTPMPPDAAPVMAPVMAPDQQPVPNAPKDPAP